MKPIRHSFPFPSHEVAQGRERERMYYHQESVLNVKIPSREASGGIHLTAAEPGPPCSDN